MSAVAMQTGCPHRIAFAGKAVQSAARPARLSRAAVVVRASAEGEETRRAVLGSLLAGVVAIAAPRASAIEIIDGTKLRKSGFDIIYDARDLDKSQAYRDGLEIRNDPKATKERIAESEKRVDTKLGDQISKKYWTQAREELRLQTGTLRFDISTLASQLDKSKRKEALKLGDAFYAKVDDLDYAMRKKDAAKANAAYAQVKTSLDSVLAALG